jgi:uncharacterized alpha/beta hydrolase family protein
MKKLFFIFSLLAVYEAGSAQSLKKVLIQNTGNSTGCSVYSFCDLTFNNSYSDDSSIVFTAECSKDSVTYGVICVKLREATENLNDAEDLLAKYLDYLKSSFSIKKSVGYGKGNQLRNNANTRGIVDYWEDDDKNSWKVKAWTDKKYIAVLYAYSAHSLPETRIDVFLNSMNFPAN